jgi:outer membrane receptor protein involved in Fe transport
MALALAAALATPAAAQTPTLNLAITAKAASEAMIDLALQANISILGVQACQGASPRLVGRFTLNQALERLARGRCEYQLVDARTVRLSPLRAPAPSPVRRAAAPITTAAPPPAPLTAERREIRMDEVVVTATKRDLALGTTAASVSVIGGASLRASNTVDSAGAAGQMAGVVITNLGPGRDKILLRGLSDGAFTGRTRSTVGVYLDDSPITYNAPDPALRLVDVERLEIIRGPQGALYGAGSLSGIFRIVTNRPDLERFSGEGAIAYGDTLSGASSYAIDGVINAPIAPGKLGLRAVAYQAVDGGYLDDVNLRLSDVDRTLRQGGRIALAARPGSGWDIDLNAAVQHLESNDTQYVTLASRQRANRIREAHKNDFSQAALTVRKRFDGLRLQSSTGLVQHRFSSLFDASAALSLFGDGLADLGIYREASQVQMLAQDIFIAGDSGGRFDWLLGLYGARTTEHSPSTLLGSINDSPLLPLYAETRHDRTIETAIYGEAAYDLTRRWTASLGARVFETRLRTGSDVVVAAPGVSRTADFSDRFDGVSPKISLQYDLGGGQTAYLLASQGYRAGGFNTSGRFAPAPGRATYASDRLQNFEVGARLHPARTLNLSASLFYNRWTGIQTDQFLPSGLAYTTNVGDGRHLGLGVEAFWSPTRRIDLSFNALATESKIINVNPVFAARVGPGLPGIPKLSSGGQITYTHPLTNGAVLTFGSLMRYVGRSRLTFEPGPASRMGGYVAGKVWAQYSTPVWRVAAFVSNPINSEGDTFAYGNPFSFGQVRQVTPQRPRTVTVELATGF